ncbi:hypothetical protein B566_EDAN009454, partial [Ephemera danica]
SRKSRAAKPDTSSFPTTCAIDCFFKQSSFYTADSKIDGDKIVAYFNSKTEVSEDIRNIFIAGVPKCLTGANAMQQIPHTCNTEAQFFSMCLYLQAVHLSPILNHNVLQLRRDYQIGRNGGRSGAGRNGAGRKGGGRNGKKNTQTP